MPSPNRFKPPLPATHNLKVKVKSGPREGDQSTVGGAWLNADGSMSIRLDVGVTLRWDDELMITAFPRTLPNG